MAFPSEKIDAVNIDISSGPISSGAAPTNTARKGSLYINTTPSSGARIFINTDGAATWTAISTVA